MSPDRAGCVWHRPLLHADPHVGRFPAAVPGAVCVHLQEAALPQEDHPDVGQWSGARKILSQTLMDGTVLTTRVIHSTLQGPFERWLPCMVMTMEDNKIMIKIYFWDTCLRNRNK